METGKTVREVMEEAKSSDTLQEILSEDKLVLMTGVSNNVPIDIVTRLISPSTINVQDTSGDTALHEAVNEERWELVPVLLQHGADINLGNKCIRTPLHMAAFHGAPADIITQLISHHNVSMQDSYGYTVLHVVVEGKRWDLLPILLQHGADVNLGECRNQTPLHRAICHGAPADIITQLISPHNINMQDEGGKTPLSEAVREERWELVAVLLQRGADVNLVDRCKKRTPLHGTGCRGATKDIISQLISPHNINVQDEDGKTPLSEAVREERWELVSVLLQRGADVNLVDKWNKHTALHRAAWRGAPADITTQLISPHNINMQDIAGYTALYWAVEDKSWELVPVLLQHGADINLGNKCNRTPLHMAAFHGAPADITTQLISTCNINMQDEDVNTALHYAVEDKNWELVPVLLQHEADVNLSNNCTQTPLHISAVHGAPANIITQLISIHNINMQDDDGETALHHVVIEKRWELVPVLLQHGANPFICDIVPEPPQPLSLQSMCIATIRAHMPVKSDEAYDRLRLPQRILPELRLKPLADEIIAMKQLEVLD